MHMLTHHQHCFLESSGFLGLYNRRPLSRQPEQGRTDLGPRPDGILLPPLHPPLQPGPSGRFLCRLHMVADGSSSAGTSYAQGFIGLVQGMTCGSPTAYLHWHTLGLPALPPTDKLHQLLVFCPLPLLSLFHPFLPGHCHPQQDQWLYGLWDY